MPSFYNRFLHFPPLWVAVGQFTKFHFQRTTSALQTEGQLPANKRARALDPKEWACQYFHDKRRKFLTSNLDFKELSQSG